jgi:hypothetical protein
MGLSRRIEMEASRKPLPQTVAEKMTTLAERYPLNKFVWIMPKLDTAGSLPEHLDFMVSTRKFSVEQKDGDVYPIQGGGLALAKKALMALAADAGIKWIPALNRRVDDGNDPDIVEWQATGVLAGLSGMTPVVATKRVDLAHLRLQDEMKYRGDSKLNDKEIRAKVNANDMQRRGFKVELAETKAQLRVIRSILGIPSKFDPATIQNKEFAVLRVIFAPHAETPEERRQVIGMLGQTFLGAYGLPPDSGGNAPALGGGVTIGSIEGPKAPHARLGNGKRAPEEVETTVEDEEPPPPAEPGPPPPIGKPTAEKLTFMQAVQDIKRRFVELLGESGAEEYYGVLRKAGHEHCNEVTDPDEQKAIYRELAKRIELLEQNPPPKAKEEPPAEVSWFEAEMIPLKRAAFKKMSPEALNHQIEVLLENCKYPIREDPKGISGAIGDGSDKAALIEAALQLVRWNAEETKRIREGHNARGGAR